jgi:nucleotide-binding universal stress UspA family protein
MKQVISRRSKKSRIKIRDEQGSSRMYANILLSTDGSDVARKGVKHGMALAAALNAKATVINVTEPLEVDLGSGHAGGWIPSPEEVDRFDAACKESAGKVLDEARAMAEQIGISAELLHVPNAHPATAIIETAKSRGCDLIVMASHGRRGLRKLFLGSQTSEVLADGSVPVLVLRWQRPAGRGQDFSIPPASRSASLHYPSAAPTSASVAADATACSWQRAIRSIRSM